MTYILDTDHLSLIQRNNQEGRQILARLATIESVSVAVTVITYEEQLRGRLSVLSKAKTLDEQVVAYRWLQKLSENYRSIQMAAFESICWYRISGLESSLSAFRSYGSEDCCDFYCEECNPANQKHIRFWKN